MIGFQHWLMMGGYAEYVWSAYAIGFIVLAANLARAIYKKQKALRYLRAWYQASSN